MPISTSFYLYSFSASRVWVIGIVVGLPDESEETADVRVVSKTWKQSRNASISWLGAFFEYACWNTAAYFKKTFLRIHLPSCVFRTEIFIHLVKFKYRLRTLTSWIPVQKIHLVLALFWFSSVFLFMCTGCASYHSFDFIKSCNQPFTSFSCEHTTQISVLFSATKILIQGMGYKVWIHHPNVATTQQPKKVHSSTFDGNERCCPIVCPISR